jgi:hypothetical protein
MFSHLMQLYANFEMCRVATLKLALKCFQVFHESQPK